MLGAVGVEPLRRHVFVDGTGQPVPVGRRQTVLRHRGEQRGGFDPDAADRIGEQAAGQWPDLLTGNGRKVRSAASRTSGSASARPRSAAVTLRGWDAGPGSRTRWRARSTEHRSWRRASIAGPLPRPCRRGPRQRSRSRSGSPCARARTSARRRPRPRRRPCRRGSRCRRWRSPKRTDSSGRGHAEGMIVARIDHHVGPLPACGRRRSGHPSSRLHGGGATRRRTSARHDTARRRRCPRPPVSANAGRGSRCRRRPAMNILLWRNGA